MLRYDKSRLEAHKASEYFTLREKQNTRRVAEWKDAVILGRGILLPYCYLYPYEYQRGMKVGRIKERYHASKKYYH